MAVQRAMDVLPARFLREMDDVRSRLNVLRQTGLSGVAGRYRATAHLSWGEAMRGGEVGYTVENVFQSDEPLSGADREEAFAASVAQATADILGQSNTQPAPTKTSEKPAWTGPMPEGMSESLLRRPPDASEEGAPCAVCEQLREAQRRLGTPDPREVPASLRVP